MEEQTIPLNDPEELAPDVDAEAIDEEWNSEPDDKLGTGGPDDDRDGEDERETEERADTNGDDGGMTDSGSDQSFTLKHLNEVATVGRDEVITLAQKGLDYDRIRGRYDEASAALSRTDDAYSLLREMAELQGLTAEELIDATRAQLLVAAHGVEPAAATARVLSMRTAKERQNARASSPEYETSRKRQTEIREFLAEYGTGIDPKSIPHEVWQSVSRGKTLLAAYQAWELKKLRADNNAAKKNTENIAKSAGSRFTFGNMKPRNAIADDWYDN